MEIELHFVLYTIFRIANWLHSNWWLC